MPAVSTTAQCIVNLLIQYFVIYTALAILRNFRDFTNTGGGALKVIESTRSTVAYAPMLCVLFLATRMRAIQLTAGNTEQYGLPQDWCQTSMQVATWSVLAQVILVLLVPAMTGESEVPTDEEGNLDIKKLQTKIDKSALALLSFFRYIAMGSLYVGFSAVIYAVITMEAPKEVLRGGTPPVAPAVAATINLCIQFFTIYLALTVVRMYIQYAGSSASLSKLESSLSLSGTTVNMAPMLCILFIGARMRALQLDAKFGSPQPWAQNAFFVCVYSVMIQAILCVAMPLLSPSCTVERGATEGDIKFRGLEGPMAPILTLVRYGAILGLYGGFTVVMCSVFLIKAKTGPTPGVSPALTCVMNLCIQYFLVYLCLFIAQTTKQMIPNLTDGASFVIQMMDSALKTVLFAPMLAILFVIVRMRSLQLTMAADGTVPAGAGPQLWAQECMFLSTWALLLQILLVVVLSFFYPVEVA
eukprot:GEMP01029334.1.p1 GENE.GEMP01029334.1~~GEMP01029334.1.p1  ORF type:complete len:471 (+),score=103.81 GEMP01029334.1:135-1547(+)